MNINWFGLAHLINLIYFDKLGWIDYQIMTQMTTKSTVKLMIKSLVKWTNKSKAQLTVQEGE